ncbi:MAG: DUF2752 domain-containing protein [Lentisphaeria bacterium]
MQQSSSSFKFRCLIVFAIGAFGFYLIWNLTFMFNRTIPPSICLGLFGFDAPTTGMTRSVCALKNLEIAKSFYLNPFTIPTILIYFYSLLMLFQRKNISVLAVRFWLIILSLAWIYRLFIMNLI